MKRKLLWMIGLTALMSALIVYGTAFTVTLEKPAASGTVTGTYVLNATSSQDMQNCTFYIPYSSLTANTSSVKILGTDKEVKAVNTSRNITFDSTIVQDASDYTFYVICTNNTVASSTTATDTSTSVIIDNTKPQTPTLTTPTAGTTVKKDDVFTYAVTGANVTACTIYFTAGTSYAMTHSADTCTYTVSRTFPPDLDYDLYVVATDGLNTSTSAKTHFKVDAIPEADQGISGEVTVPSDSPLVQQNQPNYKLLFLLVASVVILAIFFSQKNKK